MPAAWSDDNAARLKELRGAGFTASTIATEMGLTQKQVEGKLDRLGFRRPRPQSKYSGSDYFSEKGAALLAGRIRRYWAARGHAVEVWTEPVGSGAVIDGHALWQVRSNLIDGLPLPAKVEEAAA